jgi:ParB family chromosome partitioning protein
MKTPQTTTHLPISQLRIDDKINVRKIGRGADPEFIASIKAHGIQQPLIVRPNGKGHVVIAGGKRLEAAQWLVKDGEWAEDAPIPVNVVNVTDAEAREISLVENVVRQAMHPVDEYRAFAALNADKSEPLDVDAIAARFGVARKLVEQRLALGALDETILTAWHKGDIDAEIAQAFTLCPSKKDQTRIYAKLTRGENRFINPYRVKQELKIDENNVGRYLNVIGVEAYEARGGKVTRDLFGSDHVVSDPALVKTMVDEKLAETCKELVEKGGWAWAVTELPHDRYRYRELQSQFKPTPDEKKQLAKFEADGENENIDTDANEAASEAYDRLKGDILARSITAKQRAKAGCYVGIANDGTLSIAMGLITPKFGKNGKPVDQFENDGDKRAAASIAKGKQTRKTTLTKALVDRLKEQRETAIKTALVAHPHGTPLAIMLAGIIAAQINPGRWNAAPDQIKSKFDAIIDGIAPKVMNAAMRKTFDAKGYFEGAGKTFCLAAITEAVNADEARKVSKGKKGEIAKFALINVGKTGWLPKELRTSHYDGPTGKKTAPKKTVKAKAKGKRS